MVMDSHWSHDLLKKMEIENNNNDLDFLKDTFAIEIGSQSKMDRINTIGDIMHCLERGGQISENHVEPLRNPCSVDTQLQEAVNSDQRFDCREELSTNCNLEQGLDRNQQPQCDMNGAVQLAVAVPQNCVTITQFADAKRDVIFKIVSEQLGRSWRNLGRSLSISEGAMDEIEIRNPQDPKSRILRLLQMLEEAQCSDSRQLLLQLCRGLSNCGRKDLRRRVEQIMSH